jgi:hypothetical protein
MLSSGAANPGPDSEPLAVEPAASVAAGGADVLMVESLEHAEKRNAEILAEIEDYGTTSGLAVALLDDQDEIAEQAALAASNDVEIQFDEADGAIGSAKTELPLKRMTVVAALLILVLLAGFYRQEIKVFAGQTRKALAAALAYSLPSDAVKQTPAAPAASSKQTRPNKRQQTDGSIVVVVQPGDDLRQICLRNVGRYDLRLVAKIRELNPDLADPDRITVGQRIALPRPNTPATTNQAPTTPHTP